MVVVAFDFGAVLRFADFLEVLLATTEGVLVAGLLTEALIA